MSSLFYNQTVSIGYEKNVIDRNIKVVCEPLGFSISNEEILNKKSFLYSKDKDLNRFDILLIVGASRKNKIYPKEKFLEICNFLKDKNIEVIWANKDEKSVAQYLSNNASNVKMCKKMSLESLKNKIKNASLVIGGDTGPTHMAWGLNIASITIFGNTPHNRNTYITNINKVIKSSSVVDALKLDKNDFNINHIDSSLIVKLAKELLI